jgi:hypothetical protein
MSAPSNKLKDFSSRLEQRFAPEYLDLTPSEWICKNTTMRGRPFSMKGYEFQQAITDDMHPNLACKKCSQVGLTEVQIRKALCFLMRNQGTSLIFSLPEEKLFRKVAQTRILPIVQRDRIFNLEENKGASRNMAIVQLGTSWLYVTSCTEGDATSTAADAVFNDEVDLSDHEILALFSSRLQNSNYKIKQRFSTPTFAAFGIDADYNASDQQRYLHKCSACGHWNWPEFDLRFCDIPGMPAHVENLFQLDQDILHELDLLNARVVCEECRSPLTGDDEREWVAKFPSRTASRGYWVTPFSTTRITLSYMIRELVSYLKRDYLRGFYNTVLGETYSDANTQITLEDIEAAFGSPNLDDLPRDITLGIDMGQTCHVIIGSPDGSTIYRMVQVAAENIVEFIKNLNDKHNVVAGGIDREPYTPTSYQIRDLTKGRVVPIKYVQTPLAKVVNDDYGALEYVQMNRTKMLDAVAKIFREHTIKMNGYSHQKEIIKEHLRDMVRDEQPEKPAVWIKNQGHDHYFHAIGYYRAAAAIRGIILMQEEEEPRSVVDFTVIDLGKQDDRLQGYTRKTSPTLTL